MNTFIYATSLLFSNCCSDFLQVTSGIRLSMWLRPSKQKTMFFNLSNWLWQGIWSKLSQWVSIQGLLLAQSERRNSLFSGINIYKNNRASHGKPSWRKTNTEESKGEGWTRGIIWSTSPHISRIPALTLHCLITWGLKLPFVCLFAQIVMTWVSDAYNQVPVQHMPQPNL